VLSQLGTQQGLDQVVSGRIVEGDAERLERIKQGGLFNILILSLFFCALVAVYFVGSGGNLRGYWGLRGIGLMLACALLINLSNYVTTLLRSHGEIAAVSSWYAVQALIGVGLGLGLGPWLKAWGLLWGWLAGSAIAMIYAAWKARGIAPLVPRPSIDSRALLAIGFPMFLYMFSNTVMRSIDRIIILKLISTTALGYY